MSQFLSDMLHGRLPTTPPKGRGRVVSFAAGDTDIRLTTGSMRERVIGYLFLSGVPSVARDIAVGINSNPSRVTKTIKELMDQGAVEGIKHEGCVTEYSLTAQGLELLKSTETFAGLHP
ncbi:MAG: hypothetical protein ACOYBR_08370 [Fluviibacter sp.]